MISDRLFDLVRCPECGSALTPGVSVVRCASCGREFDAADGFLDLRPAAAFAEQTKYLDEALHADARHETVAPPLLGSRIRHRMLQRFLQLGPGDRALDLGCGSGRTLVWNAASGATMTGVDISAFFAREALDRCDLLLGDLRRLPLRDHVFTKAWSLDVFEHLSPQALRDVLTEANRVLAPDGALFVYTHVRKNGWVAGGVRLVNRFAGLCERIGLIDLRQERLRKSDHVNPLADYDDLHRLVSDCGFRVERLTYYTPVIGAVVENVIVRIAERFMTRRAARDLGAADASSASRHARAAAKSRVRTGGATYLALRVLTWFMMLDVWLFGRSPSGPFFGLLRKDPRPQASGPRPQAAGRPEATGPRPQAQVGTDWRGSEDSSFWLGPWALAKWPDPMRILYVAPDQTVPGTIGGSVHVQAVAEGLAARGHEVHVATTPSGAWPRGTVVWHPLSPPLGLPALRWLRAGEVTRLGRRIRAQVVIERYYNFGGEGVLAAQRLRVPAVLEVNAPIRDYPGSAKALLDRAVLIQPMRRWRDHLAVLTDLFVTPAAEILPSWIDRRRVLEIEWGADTTAFRPGTAGPAPFARGSRVWCVFAGAFRPWHGAGQLAAALRRLHESGDDRFGGLFIGDGPERTAVQRLARDLPGVLFTGAIAHADLPAYLAASDIGVAPFDPARHRALRLGFYWSPLKVFEYMAAGLPVVAPRLPRLTRLIEHGREGILYDPEAPRALDDALVTLADEARRHRAGTAARSRVVRDFSWDVHCETLEGRLLELVGNG